MRARSLYIAALFAPAVAVGACREATDDEVATRSSQSRLEPGVVVGNPTCVSLGLGTAMFKDEGAVNGTFSLEGGGTVTVSNADGNTFDWSATIGIDAVIVKGGPNALVYTYDPESMGATGLHAPTNPNNGKFYGLSHIDFCYDADGGGSSSGGSSSGGSSSGGSSSGGSSSGGSSGKTW
jgi:uncharacterized membrane protein YgcG